MTGPTPLLYDMYYHIYNRGNNRENIFFQERNYTHFMNLYAKYIEPIADIFAYCLMRNHFHLLVRIKSVDEILQSLKKPSRIINVRKEQDVQKPLGADYPSRQFSNFFNAYAKAINKTQGRTGSLFQHPFGRVPITNSRQFWNVITYIHQNPQKHKYVDDFRDWKWSSYGIIIAESPTKLKRDHVLDQMGGKEQYLEIHKHLVTDEESRWFTDDDY